MAVSIPFAPRVVIVDRTARSPESRIPIAVCGLEGGLKGRPSWLEQGCVQNPNQLRTIGGVFIGLWPRSMSVRPNFAAHRDTVTGKPQVQK